jgi:membrane protease YdiL (CAAX protease family)
LLEALGQFDPQQLGEPQLGIDQLLMQIAAVLVLCAVFVLSIVVICLNLKAIGRWWRLGLSVAGVLLLIMGPATAVTLAYMDMDMLLGPDFGPDKIDPFLFNVGMVLGASLIVLVKSGWYVLVFAGGVGEWDRAKLPGFPLLTRGDTRAWSGIGFGAVFGVIAGLVSVAVFVWLNVGAGPMLTGYEQMFAAFHELSLPIRLFFMALMVAGPAIAEELVFRGLLLGFLLRVSKGNSVLVAVSIVGVSLAWSLLHLQNTDWPVLKCAQIFLIGLVLGELARRRGVESAIAGHLALNLTAISAELLV